jgi:transposase-like protein
VAIVPFDDYILDIPPYMRHSSYTVERYLFTNTDLEPAAMNLTDPIYTDADKAREHLEATVWPNGPACPHCGVVGNAHLMTGKSTRPGLYKCRECRQPFTVTVGTVFERSKIPLNKWVLASHLMASSKKGFSAHQLHRTIGVTYKTAWFMFHRLREAMKPTETPIMGSGGGYVEADETFIGVNKDKLEAATKKRGRKPFKIAAGHMNTVFTLVERGGKARSFHISGKMFDGIKTALNAHVSREARLQTDEASMYSVIGKQFAYHGTVNHSAKEYVRGVDYTNTVENFFSVFKRGMKGVYQHCTSAHLQRYLSEFDFRYNNRSALGVEDAERAKRLLQGIGGKRLTYKRPAGAHEAI